MTDYVRDAIVKLKGDAVGVEFTGFVSNARLPSPPALEGEIWHHIHADTSGRYADGHRIKTSPIVEIHAVGNSLKRVRSEIASGRWQAGRYPG